jgi:hypothetical protein
VYAVYGACVSTPASTRKRSFDSSDPIAPFQGEISERYVALAVQRRRRVRTLCGSAPVCCAACGCLTLSLSADIGLVRCVSSMRPMWQDRLPPDWNPESRQADPIEVCILSCARQKGVQEHPEDRRTREKVMPYFEHDGERQQPCHRSLSAHTASSSPSPAFSGETAWKPVPCVSHRSGRVRRAFCLSDAIYEKLRHTQLFSSLSPACKTTATGHCPSDCVSCFWITDH